MSKKPKVDTQGNQVLATKTGSLMARLLCIFVMAGILLGIGVMLVINFGVFDKHPIAENTEIVAHNASNESSESNALDGLFNTGKEKNIPLWFWGVKFKFKDVYYNGTEYTFVATNEDRLAAKGVKVKYSNNVHTNAGTYEVTAVFYGEGYKTKTVTTTVTIKKGELKGVTFDDTVYQYKEGVSHKVSVSGAPDGVNFDYTISEVSEVGAYSITAISNDNNYVVKAFDATIYVVDLKSLVKFNESDLNRTYNGGIQSVALDTSAVPEEIKNLIDLKVEYNREIINAGQHLLIATVTAKGFDPFEVRGTVIVAPGNMEEVYGLKYSTTVDYTGEAAKPTFTLNKSYENLKSKIKVEVEYVSSPLSDSSKVGTHLVNITFTDITGNCEPIVLKNCSLVVEKRDVSEYFDIVDINDATYGNDKVQNLKFTFDKDSIPGTLLNKNQNLIVTFTYGESEIVVTFSINESGKVVSTYVLNGKKISIEHYSNAVSFAVPFDFENAGTYELVANVKGTGCDKDAELKGSCVIKPKKVTDMDGVDVETKSQMAIIPFGGGYAHPAYEAPEGSVVNYEYKGETVEKGFRKIGIYQFVKVVIVNGNEMAVENVQSFIVLPNPLWILLVAVILAIFAVITSLIIAFFKKSEEGISENRYSYARTIIEKERAGIICESFARHGDPVSTGRLYLTKNTLEFYENARKKSDKNLLIRVADIRNVEVPDYDCIALRADNKDYTFKVPIGQAEAWKKHIIDVQTAPIYKKPETIVVEKEVLVPQLVYQQPQPAPETLTTVDFQVKVKTEGSNCEINQISSES